MSYEPTTPEEALERIEAFIEADMLANARHHIREFEDRWDVSIEELIDGDRELEHLFDGHREELL